MKSQQQNLSEFNRYLLNNQQLLAQKHRDMFGEKHISLKNLPVNTLVNYIHDIFSFHRYQNDTQMHHKIIQSLNNNIQQFIHSQQAHWNEPFTPETTISSIRYCIQHNDMFKVQYEAQKQSEEKDSNHKETTLSVQVTEQAETNVASNCKKVEDKREERRVGGTVQKAEDNQFDQNPETFPLSTSDLVKKNARLVFLSFCKNQMELGGKKTFDILGEQASTMTMGKLLVYAKAYNIINTVITKELLMRRFRKISEGKRTIDFNKFYILISQLRDLEPNLFTHLQLQDPTLHKNLKFVKYPFYTQDQQPREQVPFRVFTHRVTEHSGKTQAELKLDISEKKEQLARLKSLHRFRKEAPKQGKEHFLSPRDLSSKTKDFSMDLSFIDKIVGHQSQDQHFLGNHEISYLQRKEQPLISSSVALRRKQSIVDNIRKRIQQIERKESQVQKRRSRQQRYPI